MSDVFFDELSIPRPHYNLGVGSGSHGAQTARMLEAIERILVDLSPEWVLVYGDTNSTLAGALAAAKLHIRVAHVEAGLRSFNRRMPEEINRVLTDHASDLLFAPTETALRNLRSEGIPDRRIHFVGDVMYDAAIYYGGLAEKQSRILQRLGLGPKGYLLATVHRAENTDEKDRLFAILDGLRRVSRQLPVVFPMHPRTRQAVSAGGDWRDWTRDVHVLEPVGYLDMVMLEKCAGAIATDSGGIQKEAFFHRVPCVTLREETEWTELVELGWNRVVPPTDATSIAEGILAALGSAGRTAGPYGDGNAASRIAEILCET
jgi:UDP-GlcNAc3NAcA epimerase